MRAPDGRDQRTVRVSASETDSNGDELLPRPAVSVGDRIVAGRYCVRAVIGKGGAGHVFEVENESIGRRFALKLLRCNLVSDEQVKRFHREARALGRISSPHVAQVIDFAVDPQIGPYLVMELLDGETLRDLLARRERLTVDEAVTLGVELCRALEEVHRFGIVHRDLKPSNIGLPRDAAVRVKLLDFGIAASIDGAFSEQLTHSQQFLGTMPYMAPELFRGASPSPSFDLYALGVVLFQLLTGKTPYVGAAPAVYIQQHLLAPIPHLEDVASDVQVPAWLDDLVRNLLSKQPAERLPTAAAVGEALRAGQAGRALKVAVARRRGGRRWLAALAALSALGVAVAVSRPRLARRQRPARSLANAATPTAAPRAPTVPQPTPAPAVAAPPIAAPAVAAPPVAPSSAVEKHAPAAAPVPPHRRAQRRPPTTHSKAARPWHGEILDDE